MESHLTQFESDGPNLRVAGRRLRVAGHCFTTTESILNILKSSTLGLIRPKQKFLGLRLAFMNV